MRFLICNFDSKCVVSSGNNNAPYNFCKSIQPGADTATVSKALLWKKETTSLLRRRFSPLWISLSFLLSHAVGTKPSRVVNAERTGRRSSSSRGIGHFWRETPRRTRFPAGISKRKCIRYRVSWIVYRVSCIARRPTSSTSVKKRRKCNGIVSRRTNWRRCSRRRSSPFWGPLAERIMI